MADTVGSRLKAERLAQQLPLKAVADRLKIVERYLEDIENDDFAALPSGSYPAIFIKTYARFLKLEDHELLESYYRQIAPSVTASTPRRHYPVSGNGLRYSLLVLALLAIAFLVRMCLAELSSPAVSTPAAVPADTAAAAPAVPAVAPAAAPGDRDAARVAAALASGDVTQRQALASEFLRLAESQAADDPESAARYYRLHGELVPDFPLEMTLQRLGNAVYTRGASLFTARRMDEAREVLGTAVRIYGKNSYHHYLYGRALDRTGDAAGAEAEYREAIRLRSPFEAKYHYYLAICLLNRGAKSDARDALLAFRAAGGDQRLDHQAALLMVRTAE